MSKSSRKHDPRRRHRRTRSRRPALRPRRFRRCRPVRRRPPLRPCREEAAPPADRSAKLTPYQQFNALLKLTKPHWLQGTPNMVDFRVEGLLRLRNGELQRGVLAFKPGGRTAHVRVTVTAAEEGKQKPAGFEERLLTLLNPANAGVGLAKATYCPETRVITTAFEMALAPRIDVDRDVIADYFASLVKLLDFHTFKAALSLAGARLGAAERPAGARAC